MVETIYTQEPGKYHVQYTVGGWVVVFIEDRHTCRTVDGGKIYNHRQNAYRRAKKLNDTLKVKKSAFRYSEITLDALTALDLREEATDGMQAYSIEVIGHVENAQALYDPASKRLGIAWGADATWADVDDVESGIEMWLNDPDEWIARN